MHIVKKSLFVSLVMMALVVSTVAASIVSFDIHPQSPLYRPYLADPFGTDFSLGYVQLLSQEDRPAFVYKVTGKNDSLKYEGFNINQYYTSGTTMLAMRGGSSIPLGRLSFNGWKFIPSIAIEGNVRGGFRSMFFAYSGTDLLGFDGTYYLGVNIKVSDYFTFSVGKKHHSGHIGDEILAIIDKNEHVNGTLFNDDLIDYVRQDPLSYALSTQFDKLRVYGELRLGHTGRILKPYFGSDETYKAREIQVGAEYALNVPLLGHLTFALDVTFHEMGKFLPQGSGEMVNGEYASYTFTYDKDAPWEREYNFVIAQSLYARSDGATAHIVASFHSGRFPLFAFHMSNSSFVSIGALITI